LKGVKRASQDPGFDKIEAVEAAGPDLCTVLYFTLSLQRASFLDCILT